MVETQIAEFAGCVYAGILIGFVFELFNLIIRITNAKKVMTAVLDGVCILVCIVIAAVSLYILSYGNLCLYHFGGYAVGIILYLISFHYLFKAKK